MAIAVSRVVFCIVLQFPESAKNGRIAANRLNSVPNPKKQASPVPVSGRSRSGQYPRTPVGCSASEGVSGDSDEKPVFHSGFSLQYRRMASRPPQIRILIRSARSIRSSAVRPCSFFLTSRFSNQSSGVATLGTK